MTRETLWAALEALGKRATVPVSLVLGGSAALILGDTLQRPTDDGDVVTSEPGFDQLGPLIRDVADAERLPPGWLNESIQSYTYILPPDYTTRLVTVPPFGRLHVSLLSRRDVLLMKVYGMRPRDIEDMRALVPTTDELAFVAAQITHIAMKEPEKAQDMRDFLDEWESRG
ncbi:MAG TPA: DUF6036 family nucleotidyltransferase [Gemmatimonadaceae bacterium]|jgi:hypothetical protein